MSHGFIGASVILKIQNFKFHIPKNGKNDIKA